MWEPYFKPTRRIHSSGFRCFEVGYLQIGDDKKVKKKVIIGISVDHISNWIFCAKAAERIDIDLLRDGYIRIFNHIRPVYWSLPGWSDAEIVSNISQAYPSYEDLDTLYQKQKENKK